MFSPSRGRPQDRRGSASTDRDGSPTPSTTSTSASTNGGSASRLERLQSHMLTSLLSIQSIPPPNRLPVAKNKEPLSLPTTTRNFRGFVQKSGPVFIIQDTIHETLMWDHPARTLCVMAAWAVIALHPYLLVPLPTFLLSLLLLQTYTTRYPPASTDPTTKTVTPAMAIQHAIDEPTSTGHGKVRPAFVPEPPNEGSIKYYENLRDIQNMMKMITDGYDLLAPLTIHLNWSSPSHTLLVFQGLILATLSLFFIAPYLPYRLILLIAGEGAFLLNHPWTEPVLSKIMSSTSQGKEGKKWKEANRKAMAQLTEWIKMDQLPDEVWTRGWREVEVFENERFVANAGTAASKKGGGAEGGHKWSGHNLRFGERKPWTKGSDGYADESLHVEGYTLDISRQIAMSLEDGWSWVDGDDWRIDFLGKWSPVGAVDDQGWVYTDSDWHRSSPYAFGHPRQPLLPPIPTNGGASSASGFSEEDDGEGDDGQHDEDGLPHDLNAAKEAPIAQTRRRRWLRRAVWVGKPRP